MRLGREQQLSATKSAAMNACYDGSYFSVSTHRKRQIS